MKKIEAQAQFGKEISVLERNHLVHKDVKRLGGHFVNKLEVEADADALHFKVLAEETVVVASTPPDAVALAVESHAWDDNQVKITVIGLILRLEDVEVAHGKVGVLGKFHRDDVVADHGREDDGLLQVPLFEEGLGLYFIGQGTVKHDFIGFDEVRMLFQFG